MLWMLLMAAHPEAIQKMGLEEIDGDLLQEDFAA
jgi:hypothetical protein